MKILLSIVAASFVFLFVSFFALAETTYNSGQNYRGDQRGDIRFVPAGDTTYLAAGAITVYAGIMRVAGNGAARTLTSTPSIVAAKNGTIVILQGTNDTNTLTLQDESSLTGSTLELAGNADAVLGLGDVLMLQYDSSRSKWFEISRSDN